MAARCATGAFSTTCAVHIEDHEGWLVPVGGCPAVVAQWQSTGGSSQMCPGFDSRRLPARAAERAEQREKLAREKLAKMFQLINYSYRAVAAGSVTGLHVPSLTACLA